jgi:hypothetical protein
VRAIMQNLCRLNVNLRLATSPPTKFTHTHPMSIPPYKNQTVGGFHALHDHMLFHALLDAFTSTKRFSSHLPERFCCVLNLTYLLLLPDNCSKHCSPFYYTLQAFFWHLMIKQLLSTFRRQKGKQLAFFSFLL